MKLEDFHIDLNKYHNENFQFDLNLDDTFFSLKENSLFDKCKIDLSVNCARLNSTITVSYSMKGKVSSSCERCLDPIDLGIDIKYTEAYKLTSDRDLLEEENYVSDKNPVFSIYDTVYEQICLNVPSRLICANSLKPKDCDFPSGADSASTTDPRWDELKKLIE